MNKDEQEKALRAVRSVIGVADSNFPSDCDVTITAKGKNCASITLPSYVLDGILIKKPREAQP